VSVAKTCIRVLPHRVDRQEEGVARQGGHMTLVYTILILITGTSNREVLCQYKRDQAKPGSERGANLNSHLRETNYDISVEDGTKISLLRSHFKAAKYAILASHPDTPLSYLPFFPSKAALLGRIKDDVCHTVLGWKSFEGAPEEC
jgi:hypothetical protein